MNTATAPTSNASAAAHAARNAKSANASHSRHAQKAGKQGAFDAMLELMSAIGDLTGSAAAATEGQPAGLQAQTLTAAAQAGVADVAESGEAKTSADKSKAEKDQTTSEAQAAAALAMAQLGLNASAAAESGKTIDRSGAPQNQTDDSEASGALKRGDTSATRNGVAANSAAAFGLAATGPTQTPARTWSIQELTQQLHTALHSPSFNVAPRTGEAESPMPKHHGDQGGDAVGNVLHGDGRTGIENGRHSRSAAAGKNNPGENDLMQFGAAKNGSVAAASAATQTSAQRATHAERLNEANELRAQAAEAVLKTSHSGVQGDAQAASQTQQAAAAPAHATDATHEVRAVHLANQLHQLADFLALGTSGTVRLGDKGVEANMKLYPPDLGQVHVVLNVAADATTTAQFTVDKAETGAMLEQHLEQFRNSLARHGLNVDRVSVSVSTRVETSSRSASLGNERLHNPDSNQTDARQGDQPQGRRGQSDRGADARGGTGTGPGSRRGTKPFDDSQFSGA